MKYILITLLLLGFSVQAEDSVAKYAYNVESVYVSDQEKTVSQGHGCAVAVDLSEYGLVGSKYLLSAWHLFKNPGSDSTIDLPVGKIRVKILAHDEALDICIVECNMDLPNISKLDDVTDFDLETPLTNVGSPDMVGPVATEGKLIDKGAMLGKKDLEWIATAPNFYHGSSGGAEFHNGKFFGICTGGLGDKDDPMGMKRGTACFVPLKRVRSFLRDYQDEHKPKEQPKVEAPPAPKPETPTVKDKADLTLPEDANAPSGHLTFAQIQKALKEGKMPFCQCPRCAAGNGLNSITGPRENPF